MKILNTFFVIGLFTLGACTKPINTQMTIPEQMSFTILNKNGETMVHSQKDNVMVSYTDNGMVHSFNLTIVKLPVSETDTTASSKYNGLFITDRFQMSNLSSRVPNPIHTFNLSLNGVNLGVIYLDYWQYQESYPQLSSPALTFNNVPVMQDRTVTPISTISAGSPLNLLQLQ